LGLDAVDTNLLGHILETLKEIPARLGLPSGAAHIDLFQAQQFLEHILSSIPNISSICRDPSGRPDKECIFKVLDEALKRENCRWIRIEICTQIIFPICIKRTIYSKHIKY